MVLAVAARVVPPRTDLHADDTGVEFGARPLRDARSDLRPHADPLEQRYVHVAEVLRNALVLEVDVARVRARRTSRVLLREHHEPIPVAAPSGHRPPRLAEPAYHRVRARTD